MKKLLPPVLFLITVAALAVIAYRSHTVRQQTAQATQATIQKQQTAIQSAKTELEEVQKINSSTEFTGAAVPPEEMPARPPESDSRPEPGNKGGSAAPFAPAKSAEITRRLETAHKTLAGPAVDPTTAAPQPAASDAQTIDLYMPIVVTGIIGLAALYIILSKKFESDSLKWAYGVIGTIVGFWLKSQ
jgi:hypothetical protein